MIRVFPRQTKWTPTDELAFVGDPPCSALWISLSGCLSHSHGTSLRVSGWPVAGATITLMCRSAALRSVIRVGSSHLGGSLSKG